MHDLFPSSILVGFTAEDYLYEGNDKLRNHIFSDLGEDFLVTSLDQIHGNQVHMVNDATQYRGDALYTQTKGLMIVVKSADCLPVFLFDSQSSMIALVHLSWRSAQCGILDKLPVFSASTTIFLGVGLRKCCFQVQENFFDNDKLIPFVQRREEKSFYDPVAFVRDWQKSQGFSYGIADSQICSQCDIRKFPSFRRTKTEQRTISFMALRS